MSRAASCGGLLVMFLSLFTVSANPVLALPPEQRKVYDSGIMHFDVEASSESCESDDELPGANPKEKVWNYLVGPLGFTPTQAAGIMGNIQQESGFNPLAMYPGKTSETPPLTVAWGLVQWTDGRQQGLVDFAKQKSKNPNLLKIQLEYLKLELETSYKKRVLEPLKASTTLEEATRIWLEHFEIPCLPGSSECAEEMKVRTPFAQTILTELGSTGGGGSAAVTCSEGGYISGNLALPVDKRWYDEHPDWFTKPHHDYPAADIPVPVGTNIYSITDGKVVSAPTGGDCGTGVVIENADGIQFAYCHGSDGGSVDGAHEGDTVKAGQLIMHSASTGESSGPHLHIGVKIKGRNHCPQSIFTSVVEGKASSIGSLPSSGCTYIPN